MHNQTRTHTHGIPRLRQHADIVGRALVEHDPVALRDAVAQGEAAAKVEAEAGTVVAAVGGEAKLVENPLKPRKRHRQAAAKCIRRMERKLTTAQIY